MLFHHLGRQHHRLYQSGMYELVCCLASLLHLTTASTCTVEQRCFISGPAELLLPDSTALKSAVNSTGDWLLQTISSTASNSISYKLHARKERSYNSDSSDNNLDIELIEIPVSKAILRFSGIAASDSIVKGLHMGLTKLSCLDMSANNTSKKSACDRDNGSSANNGIISITSNANNITITKSVIESTGGRGIKVSASKLCNFSDNIYREIGAGAVDLGNCQIL